MENTDNQSEIEKRGDQELIIEAPEFLEFGQNLYDQQPFQDYFKDIQAQVNIPIELLRRGTTRTFRDDWYLEYGAYQAMEKYRKNPHGIVDVNRLGGAVKVPIRDRQILRNISIDALMKLLEYPHVIGYISEQTEGEYTTSGLLRTFISRDSYSAIPTKSYAKWITDRMEREGRIKSLEVRSLVFDTEETPANKIAESGHKPGWKRWAILKASELTK